MNFFPLQTQVTNGSPNTADGMNITFAGGWTVQYMEQFKLVNNSVAEEIYVLYQCGTPAPSKAQFAKGAKFFPIPLKTVIASDNTSYAFLDVLNVTDRVVSTSNATTSPCGQLLTLCNQTAPSDEQLSGTVDTSAMAVIAPTAHTDSQVLAFSADQATGPLQAAEWIKFLALFFNKDAAAEQQFNATATAYNATAGQYSSGSRAPVVAWISRVSSDGGALGMSPVTSKMQPAVRCPSHPSRPHWTGDAGGQLNQKYLVSSSSGGVQPSPHDVENDLWFSWTQPNAFGSQKDAATAFHTFLQGVDIVVDETVAANPAAYNTSSFLSNFDIDASAAMQTYNFLQNKKIFRVDGLVSNSSGSFSLDWSQGALAKPDQALLDMVRAVQPTGTLPGHNATWLRNIAQNESVTISTPFQCSTAQTVHPGQMATATTASYQAPGNSTAVQFVCPAGGLQTLRSSQAPFPTFP
eukprot:jgi/Astpho2/1563/Aster-x1015